MQQKKTNRAEIFRVNQKYETESFYPFSYTGFTGIFFQILFVFDLSDSFRGQIIFIADKRVK